MRRHGAHLADGSDGADLHVTAVLGDEDVT
jgi:hypothetical protein